MKTIQVAKMTLFKTNLSVHTNKCLFEKQLEMLLNLLHYDTAKNQEVFIIEAFGNRFFGRCKGCFTGLNVKR